MSYQVFARKWRPQTFEDVAGQDHVVQTLRNAIEQGRVAQAYLLVGPRGTGKTTLSRIFSKALNCVNGPTVTPCGVCDPCREIAAGTSFDVSEIDGASNNKVEDVHAIRDNIQFAPIQGKFRICYIDEVHMLTASAFNALLKTLEEPPSHAKFIFATTEPEKIPATIQSRCQRFDLRRIPVPIIVERLRKIATEESIEVTDDALLAIARGADGGMRDAQSALDQLIAFTGTKIGEEDVLSIFGLVANHILLDLADAILNSDPSRILNVVDALDRNGKDLRRLSVELTDHFRNLLVYVHTKGECRGLDLTDSQRESLARQSAGADPATLLNVVEILLKLDGGLRYSLSRRTLLESALLRAGSAAGVSSLDAILRRLQALREELPAVDASDSAAAAAPSMVKESPVARSSYPEASASGSAELRESGPEEGSRRNAERERAAAPSGNVARERVAAPVAESAGKTEVEKISNPAIVSRPAIKMSLDILGGRITDIQ